MQIWFYERDAEVGDYVYADGTWSDIYNKYKTVVGICFYVDPYDKSHRLCVALKNLSSYQWGLFKNDWSEGIKLDERPDYDVFKVPGFTFKSTGYASTYLDQAGYMDEINGDPDGFKIIPGTISEEIGWVELNESLISFDRGIKLPWGMANTLRIIQHRNTIINGVTPPIRMPSNENGMSLLENLEYLMQKLVTDNGGEVKYREYYYPSASQCYAYEPVIKSEEILADAFKAGNWFLPSEAELIRLCWCHYHNVAQEESANGIFANAIARDIFDTMTGNYSSSTESSATNIWFVNFTGKTFNDLNSYGSKNVTMNAIRPVCAF